jgi:hypothetical protein
VAARGYDPSLQAALGYVHRRVSLMHPFLCIFTLLCLTIGSAPAAKKHPAQNPDKLPVLRIDKRYARSIKFDLIGVTIPIVKKNYYVRFDGLVDDIAAHQKNLMKELSQSGCKLTITDPLPEHTIGGCTTTLDFAHGVRCAFVFVRKNQDERVGKTLLEHEKYHALARLNPEGIKTLSEAVKKKGFDVNLGSLDEEVAACVIGSLAGYLQGVDLETISGDNYVNKSAEILKQARKLKPTMPKIDEKYKQSVDFDMIGASIPINKPNWYLYSGGIVDDADEYKKNLMAELGMPDRNVTKSPFPSDGFCLTFDFASGERCVYICVAKDENAIIPKIQLEYQKYHALARLNPEGIKTLSEAIKKKGFDIDLNSMEEEQAAIVIDILSLHLLGADLDSIKGNAYINRAVEIIKQGKISK